MSLSKLTALVFLIVVLLVSASVHAQNAERDAQQQLIAADRGLLEAMAGPRPNMEKYDQALAQDYIDVGFGAVHSREENLTWTKGLRDFSFQYENPHAVLLSPTSGYVLAEVHYSGV